MAGPDSQVLDIVGIEQIAGKHHHFQPAAEASAEAGIGKGIAQDAGIAGKAGIAVKLAAVCNVDMQQCGIVSARPSIVAPPVRAWRGNGASRCSVWLHAVVAVPCSSSGRIGGIVGIATVRKD
jgi:hypothetical protein